VLQVGLKSRRVALFLVILACILITLWVAIGAGIHKNYETPTPVCNLPLFFFILSSLLRLLLWSVLVLDQPSVPARSPWWRNHLDVDRTVGFGALHPTVFLGGGFLVGR
jgi:hypothetical protein